MTIEVWRADTADQNRWKVTATLDGSASVSQRINLAGQGTIDLDLTGASWASQLRAAVPPGQCLICVRDPILGWWDIKEAALNGLNGYQSRPAGPQEWWGVPTEVSMDSDGSWQISMVEWWSLLARSLKVGEQLEHAAAFGCFDQLIRNFAAWRNPSTGAWVTGNRWGAVFHYTVGVFNGAATTVYGAATTVVSWPLITFRSPRQWANIGDAVNAVLALSGCEIGLHSTTEGYDFSALRVELHYPRLGYATVADPTFLSPAEFAASQVVYRQPEATRVVASGVDAIVAHPPLTADTAAATLYRTDTTVTVPEAPADQLATQVQKTQARTSRSLARMSGTLSTLAAPRVNLGDNIRAPHIDQYATFRVVAHKRTVGRNPTATIELEQQVT